MMRAHALAALAAAALLVAAAPVERIPGPDGGWDYASVDAPHNRLLVARSNGVMAVDLTTHAVTPQFVPGTRVHAAFALPNSALGISTNGTPNTATLFDAASGAVVATLPTGAGPDAAVYDPKSALVWVMNHGDGTATLIDAVARKVAGTVTIGGTLEYAAVDGNGRLFVNVEDKDEIAVVDTVARRRIGTIGLPGCSEPNGLARIKTGKLIVACSNDRALIVDPATKKIIASLTPGEGADAVIYDSARDRAYIPAGTSGVLAMFDTAQIIGRGVHATSLPTARSARTGAVDLVTGKVYLPSARFEAGAAGQRPKLVPGSFEVLMVTP